MTDRWREVHDREYPRLVPARQFAAAAAIVLAIALGAGCIPPTEDRPPVGASPSAPPGATATATPAPTATGRELFRVYFARTGLPPIGVDVSATQAGSLPEGVKRRFEVLQQGLAAVPAGAVNVMPAQATIAQATIAGDLVTADFRVPGDDWQVRGSAQSLALVQQLVYTATEAPGIRRVLITTNGKQTQIDQVVVDKPQTREDVFGYKGAAKPDSIADAGDGTLAEIVDWRASVDEVAPGLGRFVVELRPTGSAPSRPYPRLNARLEQARSGGLSGQAKWTLWLELPNAVWVQSPGEAFHCCPLQAIGKTPIREVSAGRLTGDPPDGNRYRGVVFGIYLDDARPWRVAILHNPLRVVVDVGGVPQATSDSVAVYVPRAGETGRTVTISGFASVFEATVAWRIKNSRDQVVAEGLTSASVGTSPIWGSFQTTATIPANVNGNVTLEVFWPSPRDGADVGLVQVPLTVR